LLCIKLIKQFIFPVIFGNAKILENVLLQRLRGEFLGDKRSIGFGLKNWQYNENVGS